jgi:hypothetical protein
MRRERSAAKAGAPAQHEHDEEHRADEEHVEGEQERMVDGQQHHADRGLHQDAEAIDEQQRR